MINHNIPEPIIQRVEEDYGDAGWLKRTWIYFTTANKFRIMEDWYITLPNEQKVLIEAMFIFDGASIPFFLRPFATSFGPLLRAGLIHDYGYKNNFLLNWEGVPIYVNYGQKFFDDIFRDVARVTSHLKGLADTAWLAVRSLGFIAWNKHRKN
jgi:hypothetical protein